jgi:hypothetical protein
VSITIDILDAATVLALADIIRAARNEAPVRYLSPISDDVVTGTARHLVVSPDNYGFAFGDVRAAYLRLTLSSGLDVTLSVPEVVAMIAAETFALGN